MHERDPGVDGFVDPLAETEALVAEGRAQHALEACERLIADLEQVVFSDNGDLDKRSNPLLTHISDAFGYAVAQEWPLVQRGGVGMATVGWL